MGGGALVLPEMGAYIGTASVTARSQRPGQIQIANTDLQFALLGPFLAIWEPYGQFSDFFGGPREEWTPIASFVGILL